jgi:hypothetical protein
MAVHQFENQMEKLAIKQRVTGKLIATLAAPRFLSRSDG